MPSNPSEFRELLHRYQLGQCTPEEVRRIEAWYQHLDTAQPFDLTPTEKQALEATVWQRIVGRTHTAQAAGSPAQPGGWATWPTRVRAAAVAALLLGGTLLVAQFGHGPLKWEVAGLQSEPAAAPAAAAPAWLVYSAAAQEKRVALPDGSVVTLAPGSQLRYRRDQRSNRRLAYLSGAAFFDVFHDQNHPFSVLTDQVVSTVLGTSFRVEAYASQPDVQVQVHTGAVRVSQRTAPAGAPTASVVVLPNQQAVYSPLHQQLRRELVARPAQLAAQSFVFNDRPVAEVLSALEKAYGVDIVYDAAALRNCTINLTLGTEPLFSKLDIICETLGARYEQADGRIVFHGQPCQVE